MFICTYVHTMYIRMHVRTYVCTYFCICVCTYVSTVWFDLNLMLAYTVPVSNNFFCPTTKLSHFFHLHASKDTSRLMHKYYCTLRRCEPRYTMFPLVTYRQQEKMLTLHTYRLTLHTYWLALHASQLIPHILTCLKLKFYVHAMRLSVIFIRNLWSTRDNTYVLFLLP